MNTRYAWNVGRMASLLALAPLIALASGCAERHAGKRGTGASARIAKKAPQALGRLPSRAPEALMDVRLTDLSGESVTMTEVRGQVTVIAMWATWCKPCLLELPMLERVKRRYANDPRISVVAVSIDEVSNAADLAEVQATVKRMGLTMPVYLDQTGKLARHLMGAVRSVPLLAILDPELRMLRERGFDTSVDERTYVSAKSALIEQARRGELPAGEPPAPGDAETGAVVTALRANLKRAYPELSDDRIEELLSDLEERMEYAKLRRRARGQ